MMEPGTDVARKARGGETLGLTVRESGRSRDCWHLLAHTILEEKVGPQTGRPGIWQCLALPADVRSQVLGLAPPVGKAHVVCLACVVCLPCVGCPLRMACVVCMAAKLL